MQEKTTDEQTLRLKWKVVFPIVGGLLIIAIPFVRYTSVQENNTDKIEYNQEANKRRILNAVYISELKTEIKVLEKELKYCKEKLK